MRAIEPPVDSDTGKTGRGVVVDTHAVVRSNRLTIYSLRLLHHATMHQGKLIGFFSCLRIEANKVAAVLLNISFGGVLSLDGDECWTFSIPLRHQLHVLRLLPKVGRFLVIPGRQCSMIRWGNLRYRRTRDHRAADYPRQQQPAQNTTLYPLF